MAANAEAAPASLISIMFAEAQLADPKENTTGWTKEPDRVPPPFNDGNVYWKDMPHPNREPVNLNAIWEKTFPDNRLRQLSRKEVDDLLSSTTVPKTMRLVLHRESNGKLKFVWQTFQSEKWTTYVRVAEKGLKTCMLSPTSDFSLVELKLLHVDGRCLGWDRGHESKNDLHYVVKEPSGSFSFTSGTRGKGPNFVNVWTPQMVEDLLRSNATDVDLQQSVANFRARWEAQGYDALRVTAVLHTNGDRIHLTINLGDAQSQYHFYVLKPKQGSHAFSRAVGGWILVGILCPCVDSEQKSKVGGYGKPLPPLKKQPVVSTGTSRGNGGGAVAAVAPENQGATDSGDDVAADDSLQDPGATPDPAFAEEFYAKILAENEQDAEPDDAAAGSASPQH